MKEINWNKLKLYEKVIFSLGWLSVLNLGFWIVLIFHNNITGQEKFWTPKSYRVVYVFGWINFVVFLIALLVS